MEGEWLPWYGGECPVDGDCLVDVIHSDGEKHYRANPRDDCGAACVWTHDGHIGDIVFWRVSEQ